MKQFEYIRCIHYTTENTMKQQIGTPLLGRDLSVINLIEIIIRTNIGLLCFTASIQIGTR